MASTSKLENNRASRILTLALNKQLQTKLDIVRKSTKKEKTVVEKDPDFNINNNNDYYDDSEDEPLINIANKKTKNTRHKATILSVITICPAKENSEIDTFKMTTAVTSQKETNLCDYMTNLLLMMIDKVVVTAERKLYTKKGELRKRKKYDDTPIERKKRKIEKDIKAHMVKKSCSNNCKMKCTTKIRYCRQISINKQFWQLSKEQQKMFIFNSCQRSQKKRSTTKQVSSRRVHSFKYFLSSENNATVKVCKTFYLATLGYDKGNDRVLKNIRKTGLNLIAPKSQGKRPSIRKFDKTIIIEHINNIFHPTISHYRREHAPYRRYLPSDISIKNMYNNFVELHPGLELSYDLYRKVVSELNISFTKLGHEECWTCESYSLHKTSNNHNEENFENCDVCKNWNIHINKAKIGRQEYQKDVERQENVNLPNNELCISADLQKVIMLPRLDTFKEIIFTPRIVAFNESFVPLGKGYKNKTANPFAVLWHEAIAGRSQHDIISTYYAFFLENRDVKSITIWLDNCSSQNKNWCFISFLIYIINSSEVATQEITIKYFEPGHTFMSADAFHHQVEMSLNREKKIYDFDDFCHAVEKSNSGRVTVLKMQLNKFYTFTDYTSKYKLKKLDTRIYLKDIVQMVFQRGKPWFSYKLMFSDDLETCPDVFTQKYKTTFSKPKMKTELRGVSLERKTTLITKLQSHIPANRLIFWKELPVSCTEEHLDSE